MFMIKKEIDKDVLVRIEGVLKEKNIEVSDFQKKLKILSQHWNNWKVRGVPATRIFPISSELGVATDWLATGKGEKYPIQHYTNYLSEPEAKGEVPLISFAQVGNGSEADFNLRPTGEGRMIKTRVEVLARTFAIQVSGDSMEPEFVDGDIVIVEPSLQHEHENFVIAKKGNDVFFRQIVKEGADWLLKPLNKRYDIIPLGEYQIVGVIREKTKFYR